MCYDSATFVGEMTAAEFKAWRLAHGMTQQQLADALGMSRSRILAYEQGKSRVPGAGAEIPRTVELALEALECRAAK